MSLNELKIDVAREILNSKDEELIKFVSALFKSKNNDGNESPEEFDDLPESAWESIRKSRKDIANGKVLSWEEVKERLANR